MGRFRDLFSNVDAVETVESVVDQPGYNENARDRDGDGLVQEGTPFERPAPVKTTKKKAK
jgi:hypothetical protein